MSIGIIIASHDNCRWYSSIRIYDLWWTRKGSRICAEAFMTRSDDLYARNSNKNAVAAFDAEDGSDLGEAFGVVSGNQASRVMGENLNVSAIIWDSIDVNPSLPTPDGR